MKLPNCPHMAARCPHKRDWCKDRVNENCIHIISTTNSAAMVLTMLQGREGLSREMGDHLRGMEVLLEKVGKQLER